MRAEVARVVPAAYAGPLVGHARARHRCGGARPARARAACEVVDVRGCTREAPGLHSYRRDGAAAGRFAGVWCGIS